MLNQTWSHTVNTLVIVAVVALAACHHPAPVMVAKPILTPPVVEAEVPLSRSIMDSFRSWDRFETIACLNIDTKPAYRVYMDVYNAILAVDDSFIINYSKTESGWVMDDSNHFSSAASKIERADMNQDYFPDIVVTGFQQINGNRESFVFLSDSIKRLHFRPDITNWNMRYDYVTNRMYSCFVGSNTHNAKQISNWQGDSLKVIEGINEYVNPIDPLPVRLERYRMVGNKKIVTARPRDQNGNYFDTALFKTYY